MKRIIAVGISLIVMIFVFSFSTFAVKEISAPENVRWDTTEKYVIRWDSVSNADFYKVTLYSVNQAEYSMTSYGGLCGSKVLLFDFSSIFNDELFENGNYAVQICAYNDDAFALSSYSETLNITNNKLPQIQMLFEPTVNESNVTWEAVTGASGYRISVYDYNTNTFLAEKTVSASTDNYDLSGLCTELSKGLYSVMVTAVGDWNDFSNSSNQYYTPFGYQCKLLKEPEVWIENNVAKWNPVDYAANYEYHIYKYDGQHRKSVYYNGTTNTSVDLKDILLENGIGKYCVSVQSIGDDDNTYSSLVSYSSDYYFSSKKLPTPTGLSISNGVVSWNAVTGAVNYQLCIEEVFSEEGILDETIAKTVTSYDISALMQQHKNGAFKICVKALGDGKDTLDSDYAILGSSDNLVILSAPGYVEFSNKTLKWQKITRADSYSVKVWYISFSGYNKQMDYDLIYDETIKGSDNNSVDLTLYFSHYGEGYYRAEVGTLGDNVNTYGCETRQSDIYIYCTHKVTDSTLYYDSEYHWNKCDKCIAQVNKVKHSFSQVWKIDANYHWHECECGAHGDVTANIDGVEVKIRRPSTSVIKYGYTIVLYADIEGYLPDGWKLHWKASDSSVKLTESEDGRTCYAEVVGKGKPQVSVYVVDENNNPVLNSKNKAVENSVTFSARAGIFEKISHFFKKLFGADLIIDD